MSSRLRELVMREKTNQTLHVTRVRWFQSLISRLSLLRLSCKERERAWKRTSFRVCEIHTRSEEKRHIVTRTEATLFNCHLCYTFSALMKLACSQQGSYSTLGYKEIKYPTCSYAHCQTNLLVSLNERKLYHT